MSIDFTAQAARQQTERLSADAAAFLTTRGYTRLETDIIQPADLFLTRAGDQIITRLFTFDRRGQTLALRPEFTAIAAAAYARQLADHTPPPIVRWQFHGPVFEDAPETGQIAQTYSIGAELIGDAGLTADAEILQLAHGALTTAGLPGVRVVIGSVALLRALLDRFGLDSRTIRFLLTRLDDLAEPTAGRAHVVAQLDRLLGTTAATTGDADWMRLVETPETALTLGGRTQADIARRLAQKRQRMAERDQISAALDFLTAWIAIDAPTAEAWPQITALIDDMNAHTPAVTAALNDWRTVLDAIEPALPPGTIRLKPGLERSWDYYTGLVFELRSASGGLLGGGGRYDELVRLLGAPVDIPAVGFACAAETTAALLEGTGQ